MSKSIARPKVKKPSTKFPLGAHPNGQWCKRINYRLHYFGPVGDGSEAYWKAALAKFEAEKDDLYAGRAPRPKSDGLTLLDLVNRFLTAKRAHVDTRDITPRTFADYHATCERLLTSIRKDRPVADLRADDFEKLRARLSKTLGPVALGNEIQRIRSVFKYAYEADLMVAPVKFGPMFKRPPKRVLRRLRQDNGPKMLEAAELQKVIDAADVHFKAMVLLGLNCGFGNADIGTLPTRAIDLKAGWINHPRPKTGVERRIPLWSETVEALKVALAKRYTPKDKGDAGLAFVTKYGLPWYRNAADSLADLDVDDKPKGEEHLSDAERGAAADKRRRQKLNRLSCSPLSGEFTKLLKRLKLHRPGLGFYTLRHVFETIGGASRDQVAVNAIMGHADASMAGHYRERIDDERLVAVVNHVRGWLFPPPALRIAESSEAATA